MLWGFGEWGSYQDGTEEEIKNRVQEQGVEKCMTERTNRMVLSVKPGYLPEYLLPPSDVKESSKFTMSYSFLQGHGFRQVCVCVYVRRREKFCLTGAIWQCMEAFLIATAGGGCYQCYQHLVSGDQRYCQASWTHRTGPRTKNYPVQNIKFCSRAIVISAVEEKRLPDHPHPIQMRYFLTISKFL